MQAHRSLKTKSQVAEKVAHGFFARNQGHTGMV